MTEMLSVQFVSFGNDKYDEMFIAFIYNSNEFHNGNWNSLEIVCHIRRVPWTHMSFKSIKAGLESSHIHSIQESVAWSRLQVYIKFMFPIFIKVTCQPYISWFFFVHSCFSGKMKKSMEQNAIESHIPFHWTYAICTSHPTHSPEKPWLSLLLSNFDNNNNNVTILIQQSHIKQFNRLQMGMCVCVPSY